VTGDTNGEATTAGNDGCSTSELVGGVTSDESTKEATDRKDRDGQGVVERREDEVS
jgi:hypothetical protein